MHLPLHRVMADWAKVLRGSVKYERDDCRAIYLVTLNKQLETQGTAVQRSQGSNPHSGTLNSGTTSDQRYFD